MSAVNYKLLVASHDDVQKQANVADPLFVKEKEEFETHFVPEFAACSLDIVDRRLTG